MKRNRSKMMIMAMNIQAMKNISLLKWSKSVAKKVFMKKMISISSRPIVSSNRCRLLFPLERAI